MKGGWVRRATAWTVSAVVAVTGAVAAFTAPDMGGLLHRVQQEAMSASGASVSLVEQAEAAPAESGIGGAAVVDGDAPSASDVAADPTRFDAVADQNRDNRFGLDQVESAWLLAAAIKLKDQDGTNLFGDAEKKWRIGLGVDVLDTDGSARAMTSQAIYVPKDGTDADYDHFELPDQEDRTDQQQADIDKTKNLYVALGRLIGFDESTATEVYQQGLRWALGQRDDCGTDGGGGDVPLVGSDNLEKIYNWLLGKGFTAEQASGVVGNAIVETTTGDPTASNSPGVVKENAAWGLFQWLGSRQTKLISIIRQQLGDKFVTADASTLSADELNQLLGVQLDFMMTEMQNGHMLEPFKQTSTPEEAGRWFSDHYEIPYTAGDSAAKEREGAHRAQKAREWYDRVQGSSSSSSSSSDSGSDSGTTQSNGAKIALYGDSLSVGIIGKWTGQQVDGVWSSDATGNGNTFVGGWAKVGAGAGTIADNVKKVDGADTAVVMAGTNDYGSWPDGPIGDVERALKASGQTNLIISAVAPLNKAAAQSLEYNKGLQALAQRNNWRYVDPWTAVRADDGSYKPEYDSGDGIHPNDQGFQLVADALSKAIAEGVATKTQQCSTGGDTQSTGDVGLPLDPMPGTSSGWGYRSSPTPRWHWGMDYPAATGTEIHAVADGTVMRVAYEAGHAGNYIYIKHNINGQSVITICMHMVSPSPLSEGDQVKKGDVIGQVGTTGGSTGPHLHFEVHIGDTVEYSTPYGTGPSAGGNGVDPDEWLKQHVPEYGGSSHA